MCTESDWNLGCGSGCYHFHFLHCRWFDCQSARHSETFFVLPLCLVLLSALSRMAKGGGVATMDINLCFLDDVKIVKLIQYF
jgi:hypothetical protein